VLTLSRYDVQEAYVEQNADEIENILPKGTGQDLGAILDGCMNEAFATSCIYPKGTQKSFPSQTRYSRSAVRLNLWLLTNYKSLSDGA
jgi:hypothetical protein